MRSKTCAITTFIVALASTTLTGCPSPQPGTVNESIVVGERTRSYLVHLPPAYDGQTQMALVIALHPFTGTGAMMERMTGFSALADAEDFIVAYPDGYQRVWNADPSAPSVIFGPPADDIAFISGLIDRLIATYHVDPDRVYVTGASSGGLMANRVACELTDKLAAAASVMITLPTSWPDDEQPSKPLPFIMIQGTADPLFPWEGGTVNEGPFRQKDYLSAMESVSFWVGENLAESPPTETDLPDLDPDDGTTAFRQDYVPGPNGAPVEFYGIRGGGHTWPGSSGVLLDNFVGPTSHDIDATQVIWDFFETHTRPAL